MDVSKRRGDTRASTEPRPRGRGEAEHFHVPNLAGGQLQRSHDLAAVESFRGEILAPGPVVLQRSHDLAAVERTSHGSIWSARTSLQRSHDLAAVESPNHPLEKANSLLLQRSHDLAAVESTILNRGQSQGTCFNGATTSRPWRAWAGRS